MFSQERQVSLGFVGLAPIIAEVIEGQLRSPDPSLAGEDDPVHIRHDRLVNGTPKTDPRIAPEQAVLRVCCVPGAWIEADPAGTQTRIAELVFENPAVIGANSFVGVDVEDPVACGLIYRKIPRR